MASYYKNKTTGKWEVRFRVGGKQKHLSGFSAKRDAENAYMLFPKDQIVDQANIAFKDLFAEYLEFKKHEIRESTLYGYRLFFVNYFKTFANKPVNLITKRDILDLHKELNNKGLKWETKKKIHLGIRAALEHAKKFHGVTSNVAAEVGGFKNNEFKREMNFWTEDEFKQFIAGAKDIRYRTFFSFLFYMGVRKGEALALCWKDINPENRECKIYKSYTNKTLDKSIYKITLPKNKNSVRTIIVPEHLMQMLTGLRIWCQNHFHNVTEDSFIFGTHKPFSEETIARRKRQLCKKTGVKEIRIHDFRHSHATYLLSHTTNIYIVAKRLGHGDIKMTLNTYGHLLPNAERELIDKINTFPEEEAL